MPKKRIYIAAPLFSESERTFNCLLKSRLMDYFDVFLPQENGSLFVDLVANGSSINEASRKIFECDINAILASDILLMVLDGRTIDEGAAFELGFAFANKKVCIGLQTDSRRLLAIGNNPMIDGPLEHTFENIDSLISWARARFHKERANA